MNSCIKVLAITQNFGFGPTSMLNRALNLLPQNCEIDGYIPEHLEPLIDRCLGVQIIGHDLPDVSDLKDNYDIVVVACDYEVARKLHKIIKKVIIFDMLFWFWPTIDEIVNQDVLVIVQNFLGVKERVNGRPSIKVVGPMVPKIPIIDKESEASSKALVNLGGFTSPFNRKKQADGYVDIILPTLRTIVDSFDHVNVIGGKSLVNLLQSLDHSLTAEIDIVSHENAISMISRTSMYFTTPGLGSIYESFSSETPTFFLPPTNLTQHFQLSRIVNELSYPWKPSFDFDDLIGNEEAYISSLYDFYNHSTQALPASLVDSIKEFIASSVEQKKLVVNSGIKFFNTMGGASEKYVEHLVSRYIYG